MAELDIRRWSIDAERRIANAVREIEALRREIRGKRRGTGVTYPNFNRVGHVYGGSVAAGTDEAPVAGELKFARINTDTTTYEDQDDTPTTFYNIGPALDDGEPVVANLDIWGKYSDGQKAVWIVGGSEGGADVPSIFVGMNSAASTENDFNTPSTTYGIRWSDDETVNSDTSVFGQTDLEVATVYRSILCKVAGTYRVWYNCAFDVTSTHTASEVQRARTYIIKKVGGVGAESELPGSSCTCDLLHIDSDDMPVGLGGPRAKSHGETLVVLAANDTLRVQFEYQSGDRGYTGAGESFGAQLIKRG
jgi:hypothetical protein